MTRYYSEVIHNRSMRAKRTGAAVSGCYGFSAHSRLSGLTVVIAAAAALMLAACASGPSYAEAKASLIAPLRADQGRVIIYRPYHYVGGASLVTLAVNGQLIGQCPSNGFMEVDLPPGNVYARTTAVQL